MREKIYWRETSSGVGREERRGLIYISQLAYFSSSQSLPPPEECSTQRPSPDWAGSPRWLQGKGREVPGLFGQIAWAPLLYEHSPCWCYRFVIKKNFHKEGCQLPKQVKGGNYRLLFSGLSDGCCCQEADEYKQLLQEPSDYRNDQLVARGHEDVVTETSVSVLRSDARTMHTATRPSPWRCVHVAYFVLGHMCVLWYWILFYNWV